MTMWVHYFRYNRDATTHTLRQMSMHTSQHLLSALLETRLDIPTMSWSLTAYPTPCYVEIPRGMSLDEVTATQMEANKLVFEGRKVYVEVEELKRDQEKAAPTHESGRSIGRGLPDDYTGGVKRVVVIDGVDRNPYVFLQSCGRNVFYESTIAVVVLIFRASTIFNCFFYLIQTPSLAQVPRPPSFISSPALGLLLI
jgi:hypothetical protein